LGSASGGRAAATASEKANTDARAKAQIAWYAAKADLDKLANTSPTAELDALIADARNELARMPATRPVAELGALVVSAERCGPGAVRSIQVSKRCPQDSLPGISIAYGRIWPRSDP
jgi:hypothetical protein